jgi:hypothetical protein
MGYLLASSSKISRSSGPKPSLDRGSKAASAWIGHPKLVEVRWPRTGLASSCQLEYRIVKIDVGIAYLIRKYINN